MVDGILLNSQLVMQARNIKNSLRDKVFWIWKGILYEQNIGAIHRMPPRVAVEFRFGDFVDIERLDVENYEYDSEAKQFAWERLQSGDKVILGEYQGHVVFYVWLMFNTMDVDYRSYIPISLDRVYVYKRFTVREYRGKNIAPAAYSFIADNIEQLGCKKLLGLLDSRNLPSIRATIKLGYYRIGSIYKIRLLSNIVCFISKNLRRKLLEDGK